MPQLVLSQQPINPAYVRALEAEKELYRAIAADRATPPVDALRLLRLFDRTGFPVDGPSPEYECSSADLAALWDCSKDAVSDILKDFESRGAITRAHRYGCCVCTYHGPRFFDTCPHCGVAGMMWCHILITAQGLPANHCVMPPPKPKRAPSTPLLMHDVDGCRHKAPAPAFTPFRRCPGCGAIDDAEHFRLCRKRSAFLRVLPPPPPPTPEEQAEIDALEQADRDAVWGRIREADPSFDDWSDPPDPESVGASLVQPPTSADAPGAAIVARTGAAIRPAPVRQPTPDNGPGYAGRQSPPREPTPYGNGATAPAPLPAPVPTSAGRMGSVTVVSPAPFQPKRNVTHPGPAAPPTVGPTDPWQCLCGGRVFNLKDGALRCVECGTVRRAPMPGGP